jgi:hypothetical protein
MGTEAIPKTEEKLTKLNCVIAGVVKPTVPEMVHEMARGMQEVVRIRT